MENNKFILFQVSIKLSDVFFSCGKLRQKNIINGDTDASDK